MHLKYAAAMAGLVLGLFSSAAQAAYIIDFEEVGADVVATGSGSIDLSDLTSQGSTGLTITGVFPFFSSTAVGTGAGGDLYSGVTGPGMFGFGGLTPASSTTGAYVGISGFLQGILVPTNYQSGQDLGTSTATYLGQTFTTLGLTPGTYTAYLGGTTASDTFTIQVGGGMSPVPLPASAPMFGAALLALGIAGYGVSRRTAASQA